MARRLWTAARIAALRDLWGAGQSAAAIGKVLGGITRSAVLGQVFRLRLAAAARGRAAPAANETAPARRRPGKPPPRPVKPRRHTLFDLTNECCRWPFGELGSRRFYFCGAAGADVARGIPYCPHHMARGYIVPPSLVKPKLPTPLRQPIAREDPELSVGGKSSRALPRRRDCRMRKFG